MGIDNLGCEKYFTPPIILFQSINVYDEKVYPPIILFRIICFNSRSPQPDHLGGEVLQVLEVVTRRQTELVEEVVWQRVGVGRALLLAWD